MIVSMGIYYNKLNSLLDIFTEIKKVTEFLQLPSIFYICNPFGTTQALAGYRHNSII
jgi:hypothetical protein